MVENCKVNDCHRRELVAEIVDLRRALDVGIATIEHLNDLLVGQPDHDVALAADTQLILRDLRSVIAKATGAA